MSRYKKTAQKIHRATVLAIGLVMMSILWLSVDQLQTNLDAPPQDIELEPAKAERPYDQPDAAAQLYQRKRAAPAGADITELYMAALEHRRQMPRYSTRHGITHPTQTKSRSATLTESAAQAAVLGTWEPLGPGNIGGRTRALLIDPQRPNVIYAAGVSGGVFKTTNGGGTWRPLTDMLPNIAISTLAMDPTDSNVIYAGTGEGHFREVVRGTGLPLRGAGIFKTVNDGATWTRLGGTVNSNFHWVNDLVVSVNDRDRVYAATRSGVWRSTNGGRNWQRALNPRVQGGCFDLAMRSDRAGDYLFASCGTFEQATLYRQERAEGDSAWTAVLSEAGMGRTSLAIAPSNQNIVYALAASYLPGPGGRFNGGLHAVFRSNQSGNSGTWTAQVRNSSSDKLSTLLLSNPLIAHLVECGFGSQNGFSTLGWYTNTLAVDPTDPNVVWGGGVDLFRSDDAGRSWGPVSHWSVDGSAHADQHQIVFHPDYDGAGQQTMFLAGDGGVYRTDNARARKATGPQAPCSAANTDVRWRRLNRNLAITQFYHGAPYPDGRTYLGGTQDNGTVLSSDARGTNGWIEISGGDGGYVAVDPTATNTLYVESQNLALRKSTDGGATFFDATNGLGEGGGDVLFITPFVMDPSDPNRLWTGGRRLWRTTNGATNWTQASTPLDGAGKVSAIAVAASDPNRVVVGLDNGSIHRNDGALSSTQGTTWPATRPRSGFVSWITIDDRNANLIYATYAGFGGQHVWKSSNGGADWQSLDGQGAGRLPNIPVHALVIDPSSSRRLYLGTDLGVFVSTDGGETWGVENTGFANAVTESLAISRGGSRPMLFAFTHGRGAWRVPLDGSGGDGGDGGDGGGCSLPPGHPDYCRDCGPCGNGEGDCDRDSDCGDGLSCVDDSGTDFGFGPQIDVCVADSGDGGADGGCLLPAGHPDFCRECGPCGNGEGDCDRDSDCSEGLSCIDDLGADFGFGSQIDVCIAESGGGDTDGRCPLPAGHPDFCRECGPCGRGEGDCDRDSDCGGGLSCVDDIGADFGFGPGIDVCAADGGGASCPLPAGHPDFCRDCGPCARGQGDCDRDNDCLPGLGCVDDIGADFGFGPGIDVCR